MSQPDGIKKERAINRNKDLFIGDQWGPDRPGGRYEQFAFESINDRGYVQLIDGEDLIVGALAVKTHTNNQPGESIKPLGGPH